MKATHIMLFTFAISGLAASPAEAEALLDQGRVKPFAVRAMGFDKPAFRDAAGRLMLPSVMDEREAPELQVPGLHIWPVFSEAPAPSSKAAAMDQPKSKPAPLPHQDNGDKKGPRVW